MHASKDMGLSINFDSKSYSIKSTIDIETIVQQYMLGFCVAQSCLDQEHKDVSKVEDLIPHDFTPLTFPLYDFETSIKYYHVCKVSNVL